MMMKIIKGSALKESFFNYKDTEEIPVINKILKDVRQNGDDAIKRYTLKFDGVRLSKMRVADSEIKDAYKKVDPKIVSALKYAAENIRKFARKQSAQFKDFEIETAPGVFAGQKVIPIERVGIYVPGGKFPLASTLLMCAIPANVASVPEIIVCSPPSYTGSIHPALARIPDGTSILGQSRRGKGWVHPAILIASDIAGVNEIYKVGGVQAIGAMAYGTRTIKRVDKIVGPGNKYVASAKKEVFGYVGIDFIAGPSEVIIIADETANPDYIAADLLAQSEHDRDALPILITTSAKLAERVNKAVGLQLQKLKTKDTAKVSISNNGRIIIVNNMDEAINITNKKAPEHLELQVKNPERYTARLRNYGSLFIGKYSPVVLGDYNSGLNHTLPTNTTARYTGGLGVKDFLKIQTTLRVTKDGLPAIGTKAKTIADAEGLDGHAKSIAVRCSGYKD